MDLARQLGGFVIDCKSLGQGAPDAFICAPYSWITDQQSGRQIICQRRWIAVEIKSARGKLTPQQKTLHAQAPVLIWRCEADVLAHFGVSVP